MFLGINIRVTGVNIIMVYKVHLGVLQKYDACFVSFTICMIGTTLDHFSLQCSLNWLLIRMIDRAFQLLFLLPGASLHTADSKYFWFHHSQGDTMTVQEPAEMNLCSAVWAVVAYVVADLDEMLPR